MTNQVIKAESVGSTATCANLCSQETDCWAFNVIDGNETKLCELNGNSEVAEFMPDEKSTYYG